MKRILVTGGLGHIGSKLLEIYSKETSSEVIVIDRVEDTRDLCNKYGIKAFLLKDIRDIPDTQLVDLLDNWEVEAVIHLAATVNAIETVKDEQAVFDNNTQYSLLLK